MAAEGGLDLAGLDPVAAQFELVVDTPEEVERAVGTPTDEIPRPVQATLWREWIDDELVGGELGTIEIATRDPTPPMYSSPGTPTGTGWRRRSRT